MRIRQKLLSGFGIISIVALLIVGLIGYYTSKLLIENFVFQNVAEQININVDSLKLQYQTTLRKEEVDLGIIYKYFFTSSGNQKMTTVDAGMISIELIEPDQITKSKIMIPDIKYNGVSLYKNKAIAYDLSSLVTSYYTIYILHNEKLIRVLTSLKLGNELAVTTEIGEPADGTYIDKSSKLYGEIIKGNSFVGTAEILGRTNIVAMKPIINESNIIIGAISAEVKPEKMERLKERMIASKIGESGNIEIFNTKGYQLIHNSKEGQIRDDDNHKKMIEMKQGRIQAVMTADALDPMETADTEKYYVFGYLPELEWILAGNVYIEEFYQPIYTLRNRLAAISVFAFILMIVMAIYLSNKIVNPLNKVNSDMTTLVEFSSSKHLTMDMKEEFSDISTDIESLNSGESPVEKMKLSKDSSSDGSSVSGDEISLFAVNFELMADQLKKSFSKIEYQGKKIEEYANHLEDKVQERTSELNSAMEELRAARDALWGEMALAKKIQTVLLPNDPKMHGYDISASLTPADEVGGDYYDVITVNGKDWLVIGDVSGHGVPAGLIMMMVQTAIHTVLSKNPNMPTFELLAIVNAAITENIKRLGESKYMTMTVFAAIDNGEFSFAGLHQDILIYRSASKTVETIETSGMWIGIEDDITTMLPEEKFKLECGDVLVLYTDGVTEAIGQNSDMYGDENLVSSIKKFGNLSAEEIHGAIINELKDYIKLDDLTVMVIKRLK